MHWRSLLRDERKLRARKLNLRNNDSMAWRLYFLLTVLILVFAFANALALQKLNAMESDTISGPAATRATEAGRDKGYPLLITTELEE
jgi:hypothetical protein